MAPLLLAASVAILPLLFLVPPSRRTPAFLPQIPGAPGRSALRVGVAASVLAGLWLLSPWAAAALLPVAVVFVAAPHLAAGLRRELHRDQAVSALPDFLDDLALLVDTGLPPWTGLRLAQKGAAPALRSELEILLRSLDLNPDPREPLEAFARRLQRPVIDQFVGRLLADRDAGISFTESIGRLAQDLRIRESLKTIRRDALLPLLDTLTGGMLLLNCALLYGYPTLVGLLRGVGGRIL